MPQRALRCAFKYWHSLQPALRASAVNAAGLRNCVTATLAYYCPHPCSAVKRSELPAQRAATNPMLTAYSQSLRGSHRNVLLLFAVSALLSFSADGGINTVLFNLYILRLGFGPDTVGLINGVATVFWAAGSLLAGWLGTVWGVRRTACSGLWFALIGACLLPFAGSVPVVQRVAWLTLCALTGYTGLALYFVNALPFLMQVTSLQNRANVFAAAAAVSTTAMVGGGLAGGVLPGLFASALGVTMASPEPYGWTLAVVPLFVVAALLVFMQTQEPAGHSEPDAVAVEAQSGGALQGTYGLILMLGLVRFLQVAALGGGLTFFNVYMDTALAVPTFWVGVALAGARLAAVPTALLGPAISRRLGLGNTVVFSSILVAICVLPLALVPTPVAATLGMVGLLLFSNIRYPAFNIYMLDAVPVRMRPMMSGVNEMAAGASFALIALVGGLIIVRHGYSAAFLAGGAITLLGSFVFAVMLRRRN